MATRVHGRSGVLYLSPTNNAAAVNVPVMTDWSINFNTDFVDVTALGDSNHVYVAGLPDAQGDFTGFWDNSATSTFATAAVDGLARYMYLYPDGTSTRYWYGSILLSADFAGGVSSAVSAKASWRAATAITKQGI